MTIITHLANVMTLIRFDPVKAHLRRQLLIMLVTCDAGDVELTLPPSDLLGCFYSKLHKLQVTETEPFRTFKCLLCGFCPNLVEMSNNKFNKAKIQPVTFFIKWYLINAIPCSDCEKKLLPCILCVFSSLQRYNKANTIVFCKIVMLIEEHVLE